MALIKWDGTLSVGHSVIDEQHQNLISIINTLHDFYITKQNDRNIKLTLMELYKYTVFHFSEEEKLMDRLDPRVASEHKLEHEKFIQQLDAFSKEARFSAANLESEMFTWLMTWLIDHVSLMDKKLVAAVTNA